MNRLACSGMKDRQAIYPPAVFVHSRHPLVFQAIARLLAPVAREIKPFSRSTDRGSESHQWVVIFDTCTVEEWLNLAMECGLRGGRSIVLLPETSQDVEIRLVYLGVHGAISIPALYEELTNAVDKVMNGHLWFRRSTLDEYVKCATPGSGRIFSLREEQVIILIAKRFSNKQIGNALGISERTVKFHVSNILQKCNVKSRRCLLQVSA